VKPFLWLAAILVPLAACQNHPAAPAAGTSGVDPVALHAAASDPRLARFYQSRGWRAAWTPASEAALRAAIGAAGRHALDAQDFLRPLARAGAPAAHDAALSLAALAYASALASGRVDPGRLHHVYTVPRPRADLAAGLERALAEQRLGPWLESLAPQDAEYKALADAWQQARAEIARAGGNAPAALVVRARTLAVNLERRRWLERTPPATRIDVNTAAATLAYWRDGALADSRRAVVGEPGRETPELGSPLYRLAANPTWTIPRSIEGEVSAKGAAYLARNRIARRDGWLVQESGPRNSLGLVKFDLRNDQEIYLHDTPAKALFAQPDRHESHGCVRVHDALGFAELLAADQCVGDAWHRARATGEENFVPLPRPIPVRLLYQTAFLANGAVAIVADAYGWDEEVAEALGLPPRPRTAAQRRAERDLGP
jgi:murein L,D-transpeptidase YcbB/YkuD